MKIKLQADFSFLVVIGLMLCSDKKETFALCMISAVMHELGHITVMLCEGRPPEMIRLYGGGIQISGGSTSFPAVIAGVTVNLAVFAVFGLVEWEIYELRLFGMINLLLAVFNLLPIGELDGKLLLDKLLVKYLEPQKAVHMSDICEKCACALVVPAVVLLVFSEMINFSAIIFFFYLFAVERI